MTPDDWRQLSPSEAVPGRPFADPARVGDDLPPMLAMGATLRRVLDQTLPETTRPILLQIPEADRQHRVAIANNRPLHEGRDLAFVAADYRPDEVA